MTSLSERYRPRKLDELVGQAKIVKRLALLRDKNPPPGNGGATIAPGEHPGEPGGWRGRVLWLVGESGSGKTSAARIIAAETADPYAVIEKDAQEFTMDFVRELERMCQFKPIGNKMCHVFICNEAHRLSDRVVSRLQTVLEEPCVQRNSTWIFTTTNRGQQSLFADKFDACPFLSRATILNFESRGEQLVLDYACHVRKIAQAEGMDGKPIADYIALVKLHKHNLRACLGAIESGAMLD